MPITGEKKLVQDFWDAASCGEDLYLTSRDRQGYVHQSRERYALEPYIREFAGFAEARGRRVLEVGVGLGADHQCFAEAGADLFGMDLTPRAIEHVRRRFAAFELPCRLIVGDAENLPFGDDSFDLVYAWGVIHHSPDTAKAARELLRVVKPGGRFRVMIYHKHSIVGAMLWVRYALLRGRVFSSLAAIYARHLESPGTKAFTPAEAKDLFAGGCELDVRSVLTHGDLLTSDAGQRHRGPLLTLARRVWPRRAIGRLLPGSGLFLLIAGRKVG